PGLDARLGADGADVALGPGVFGRVALRPAGGAVMAARDLLEQLARTDGGEAHVPRARELLAPALELFAAGFALDLEDGVGFRHSELTGAVSDGALAGAREQACLEVDQRVGDARKAPLAGRDGQL